MLDVVLCHDVELSSHPSLHGLDSLSFPEEGQVLMDIGWDTDSLVDVTVASQHHFLFV